MSRFIYAGTIKLPPVSKKNSQQIFRTRDGRSFIAPSKKYREYEHDAGYYIRIPDKPISERVNVKALYYMPTRRIVDLTNLNNALHDVLVKYGVVEDDNSRIIAGSDGSRVRYDKENPRTEFVITKLEDDE